MRAFFRAFSLAVDASREDKATEGERIGGEEVVEGGAAIPGEKDKIVCMI